MTSPLGQVLKRELRAYFNNKQRIVAGLRIEDASRREYEDLADYLGRLDRLRPGMSAADQARRHRRPRRASG